jgi:hypothetical protein
MPAPEFVTTLSAPLRRSGPARAWTHRPLAVNPRVCSAYPERRTNRRDFYHWLGQETDRNRRISYNFLLR